MVRVLLVLVAVGAASATAGPPEGGAKPSAGVVVKPDAAKKLTPAEFRKRFFRCWLEVEKVEKGKKVTDPENLSGMCFSDRGNSFGWGRRGELSSGPSGRPSRLDATADPVRLDIRAAILQGAANPAPERISVWPCIVKFDGDKLVIAHGPRWWDERKLKPGEDYGGRPKDFTSTKENGVTVATLMPCHDYQQDLP